jgi:hypothetical protein
MDQMEIVRRQQYTAEHFVEQVDGRIHHHLLSKGYKHRAYTNQDGQHVNTYHHRLMGYDTYYNNPKNDTWMNMHTNRIRNSFQMRSHLGIE